MALLAGVTVMVDQPAHAAATGVGRPTIQRLSITRDATWGGRSVTIIGTNLVNVRRVTFGRTSTWIQRWVSPTRLIVASPGGPVGVVDVRVTTAAGTSRVTRADRFKFTPPTVNDPINGGWTARQAAAVSARYMRRAAALKAVPVAPNARAWTAAMGRTAARRALAWVGLPYAWAGGTTSGPTRGTCYSGDGGAGALDCHVWGFDCSGLTLYGWGPYASLPHFAASQFAVAGRFHPSAAQLEPGDLLFYGGSSGIGHVVMYVGGGKVVQAPQSGHPIIVSRLSDMWGHYFGAVRPRSVGQQGPAPVVSRVSSSAGSIRGGGTLTIYGRGFTGATAVSFGGALVYSFRVVSPSRIQVRVPAHTPATVHVQVAGAWGTSRAISRDRFTFVDSPSVTGVSASSGSTAGGQRVTVTGRYFSEVTAVTIGGARATALHVVSSTRMLVTSPAHAAGTAQVTVTTRFGTSVRSAAGQFTYVPAPTVTGLAPSSGPTTGGSLVTVTGTAFSGRAFSGPVRVWFGDVAGTEVQVLSSSRLTVRTPAGATGPISVVVATRYGTSAPAAVPFTYVSPPSG